MTDPHIIFIGAPETAADLPDIDFHWTNGLDAQARAGLALDNESAQTNAD